MRQYVNVPNLLKDTISSEKEYNNIVKKYNELKNNYKNLERITYLLAILIIGIIAMLTTYIYKGKLSKELPKR